MLALLARWWSGLRGRRSGGHLELGRRGEDAAARLLQAKGYRLLGRNVRTRAGEADLVCLDPDGRTIVIVEVKTRQAAPARSAPRPEASVHRRKQRRLRSVARLLSRANGWTDRPVRIDVVAVDWPRDGGKPTVRHLARAVRDW